MTKKMQVAVLVGLGLNLSMPEKYDQRLAMNMLAHTLLGMIASSCRIAKTPRPHSI